MRGFLFCAVLVVLAHVHVHAAEPFMLPSGEDDQPPAREHVAQWMRMHVHLAEELAQWQEAGSEAPKVMLFGDSITEAWRDTSMGRHVKRTRGVPQKLKAWLGKNAMVIGISGDTAPLLMWRLNHGENIPTGKAEPSAIVVLIGTNELHAAADPNRRHGKTGGYKTPDRHTMEQNVLDVVPRVAEDTIAVVDRLLQDTEHTQIVLQAILPRGEDLVEHPVHGRVWEQPGLFTEALTQVNELYKAAAEERPRVTFVDCGHVLQLDGGKYLGFDLAPDGLHPGPEGHARMAKCVDQVLPPEVQVWGNADS